MALIALTFGLIAFFGGAVMRRQQMRVGHVGTAQPTNGYGGASALIRDYFRILPLALVGFGALLILGSVLSIAFSLLIS